MGQTLSHGVYLPNEGERNCYAGLASNWQILNTAVGAIAEKAPLVHTHSKADITDFPAYGTTAGTICEGNDSRLSDARTPVAHTHTKSDVTNLFNSANTWTENNTFSKTVAIERSTDTGNFLALKNTVAELGSTPASATPVTIAYRDKNNDNLGYMGVYYDTDGSNHFRLYVRNKFTSGAPSTSGTVDYAYFGLKLNADKSKEGILKASFRPYDNNAYDLGSSSYQWNNLYAKNYFYNGVAWGLDKANEWTGLNTFSSTSNCIFSFKFGSSGSYNDIRYYDSNNSIYACLRSKVTDLTLGVKYSSKSAWYDGASVVISNNGNVQIKSYDGTENWTVNFTPVGVYPTSDKALELGTSTNKWKSLNGINPGALSLPVTALDNTYDISGDITDLTGGNNSITVARTGWIFVKSDNATEISIENTTTGMGASDHSAAAATLMVSIPVTSGETLNIIANCTSIDKAYLLPCQGNV